ncbi:Uncharacterized protein APZ42_023322 [Daphnia magna]|uniref:Uncharacterized protein n=1 Tax=Daphnia magna TaxID=35525 RepID=A0A0P6CQB2_9CRUS|nr:Uncharacterized protein APZ42_023322 [Daphnia magna]
MVCPEWNSISFSFDSTFANVRQEDLPRHRVSFVGLHRVPFVFMLQSIGWTKSLPTLQLLFSLFI